MSQTSEREPIPQHEQSPEEVIAEIQAYFAGAEIGSVKFLALHDYARFNVTGENLEDARKWLEEVRTNAKQEYTEQDVTLADSSLRIAEMDWALTNQSMEEHHSTLPGHYQMVNELSFMTERLGDAYTRASVEDSGFQRVRRIVEIRDAIYTRGNSRQTEQSDTNG